jgi:hypothetical protein
MRALMRLWKRQRWIDQLAVALALACLVVLGLGGIVRFASPNALGYYLIIAGFCLLMATSFVYFAFGSSGPCTVRSTRWLALAGTFVLITITFLPAIPGARPFEWLVGQVGFLLWLLAFLVYELTIGVRGIRYYTGASALAAGLVATLFMVFLLTFSSFVVFLASNGDAAAFTLADPAIWSHLSWLSMIELTANGMVAVFIVVVPEFAHRAWPWSDTSELTKSSITGSLAMCAALLTGLFVFMSHFHRGPLAHIHPGPLVVGILFAVALLVPIYRSAVRAFWKWGVLHLIDLGRWRADWQKVREEMRAGLARLEAELDVSPDSEKTSPSDLQPANESSGVVISAGANPGHPSDRRDLSAEHDHSQGRAERVTCDGAEGAALDGDHGRLKTGASGGWPSPRGCARRP